jgi:hypothetical protein
LHRIAHGIGPRCSPRARTRNVATNASHASAGRAIPRHAITIAIGGIAIGGIAIGDIAIGGIAIGGISSYRRYALLPRSLLAAAFAARARQQQQPPLHHHQHQHTHSTRSTNS